jgi:hypothetical protein
MKKPYTKPAVTMHGDIRAVTLGGNGNQMDGGFFRRSGGGGGGGGGGHTGS